VTEWGSGEEVIEEAFWLGLQEVCMETKKEVLDGVVTLRVKGKLNAVTAEEFGAVVEGALPEATAGLVLDFAEVTYVASAGLRVLMAAQKKLMPTGQGITVRNVCGEVREVFEVTGLDDVFQLP
jgi:anti-sigma B factor antagonist